MALSRERSATSEALLNHAALVMFIVLLADPLQSLQRVARSSEVVFRLRDLPEVQARFHIRTNTRQGNRHLACPAQPYSADYRTGVVGKGPRFRKLRPAGRDVLHVCQWWQGIAVPEMEQSSVARGSRATCEHGSYDFEGKPGSCANRAGLG